MGKVVRALVTPLSIIDKRLGNLGAAAAMVGAGLILRDPGLISAGISLGSSALKKGPKAAQPSRESIERLNASVDPRTPRKIVFGKSAARTAIR